MIDLSVQEVANLAHVCMGALFVLLPYVVAIHHPFTHPRLIGSVVGVMFAAIKEGWYDRIYEDPQTNGGLKGGILDFCGYMAGILSANLILWF